jgi:hypothetical protein
VYDMYPWDKPADVPATPPVPDGPATRAVQFALDRRDNGGEASGAAGQ